MQQIKQKKWFKFILCGVVLTGTLGATAFAAVACSTASTRPISPVTPVEPDITVIPPQHNDARYITYNDGLHHLMVAEGLPGDNVDKYSDTYSRHLSEFKPYADYDTDGRVFISEMNRIGGSREQATDLIQDKTTSKQQIDEYNYEYGQFTIQWKFPNENTYIIFYYHLPDDYRHVIGGANIKDGIKYIKGTIK